MVGVDHLDLVVTAWLRGRGAEIESGPADYDCSQTSSVGCDG